MSNSATHLPTGTVTFLFTDIEGSTQLVSEHGDRYEALLAMHAQILRAAIATHAGTEVSTEGDSFFAVFSSAVAAVRAAVDAQRALASHAWPADGTVRVRMGLHSGEGRLGGDSYVGIDVHRAARIAAAGHGGQVLLSEGTRALVEQELPVGAAMLDLGEHRLKDLPAPEHLWQLEIEGLQREFPVIRSLDARPNNLPLSATALIGRDAEISAVAELLPRRRVVTVTGPGGIGKTRLALAVAQHLLPAFADGAFLVALEDARDRAAVASAIASALGVREKPDRDLEQGTKEFVRGRALLLVLDNFEQVLSAAPLVSELLAGAPRLRIIVTSRAVLNLSGEQDYEVRPLSLPEPQHLPSLAELAQYEAVALFIDRARAVKPDFAVTNENAVAVAEICGRLDGLPLAIELAAARVRLLTPQTILDRLDQHLPVLARGAQDLPARLRTLRGTIGWSYELLDNAEQRLFERLAVFAGGWTLAAADDVCNLDAELGIETLDGLASLADKSLIRPVQDDDRQESRFGMLQVMREFASEKLDGEPEADEVHRRHARHMLALAEEAEPQLVRADVRLWQQRLRREHENLRTALRWAIENDEAEIGLRTAGAVWRFWHYWLQLREGIRWLEALLDLPAAAEPNAARAKGLTGLAGVLYWQGQLLDRVGELYDEALAIYRQLGDEQLIADTLVGIGSTAFARGDLDVGGTLELAEEAVAHYRHADDMASATAISAMTPYAEYVMDMGGSMGSAVAATRDSIEVLRRHGRAYDAAEATARLAFIYHKAGDYPRAIESFREATKVWYEIGNSSVLPYLKFLARLELAQDRPERAVRLAAIAARAVDELGGEVPRSVMHVGNPMEEARPLLAEDVFARAVEEGRAMSFDQAVAYVLEETPARVSSQSDV